MRSPFALLLIICHTGFVPALGLSVWQTPETIITTEGANVSITCHIEANEKANRIIVSLFKNNVNRTHDEVFNTSKHQLYGGNIKLNATLHLTLLQLNHTGIYYCKVWQDLPTLESLYGNGTHILVYIVNNSATVTSTRPSLTISSPATPSEDTVMLSSLSGLGILLLIICIALVIYIHYRRHFRSDNRAKAVLVDTTTGSQCPVTSESVVYAAINISKNGESVKTRSEVKSDPQELKNCEALVSAPVTCIEDSVTYSEVHIKHKPKHEGDFSD